MLSGRAAAWAPAKCEKAHVADLGAPHLCGRADRPAGALQLHAAPTPEPEWHLCKPQQDLEVDSLPPSAELHHRGLLCGRPSDP